MLMNLLMPGMDGVSATAAIRQELPETEVVALTSVLEDDAIVQALKAGAIGYLIKDTNATELRRAIKAAAAGQVQLSPEVAKKLVQEIRAPESPETLTRRETEVLRLLAHGLSNREIGGRLGVREATVKSHVGRVLAKLGLLSRTQAALYAVRVGLASTGTEGRRPRGR